jgi:outer membrane protein insertion porin family
MKSRSQLFSLLGLLLFVLSSLAAHAQAPASPTVRSIEVQYAGPPTVSKERIIANMRTKVGKLYSEQVVEEDIRNLYNTGSISNVRIFGEPVRDGVKVIVVIQTKATVGEVVFQGVTKVKVSKLRKDMKIKPGSALNEANLEVDRQKILEIYDNEGYANTKVEYKVEMNDTSGSARVIFIVTEADRTVITQIRFEGNDSFKTKVLRKAIKTRTRNLLSFITKDGRLDSDKIDQDVIALREFYQNHGYIDVNVQQPDVNRIRGDRTELVFHIVEGRQYHVHSVTVAGANVFTTDQVRARLKTKEGGVFSPKVMHDDVKAIQDLYGARGYVDLQVDSQTTTGGDLLLDVTYKLEEGNQSYVERINVQGNTRTKDKVIRREVALAPGDLYNTVLVDASKKRLENLKYFSRVDTYPSDTEIPGRKDLNVLVEEQRTGSFNFGAGFSSIDSLLGFVEITQSNFDITHPWDFTGGGQRFRARVQIGTVRKDAVISLTEPWFMDHQLSVGGEAFYHEDNYSSNVYSQRSYGFDLSARKPLGKFTSVSLAYQLEEVSIYNVTGYGLYSPPILNAVGDYWKSSVSTTLSYDTRDSIFLTRKGERVEFSATTSGLGGDVKDYGFDLLGSKYFLLPFDTILSLNGEVGTVASWGGSGVPLFDRLYLGGANNLRGFNYRDVGPKDIFGDPIGGDTLARATVEYTFPVIERVRGAVFYDTGFVNAGQYDFTTSNINSDVGLGVRLDLPIGPVRIDYGFPLQKDSFSSGGGKFNFNVGYQF